MALKKALEEGKFKGKGTAGDFLKKQEESQEPVLYPPVKLDKIK